MTGGLQNARIDGTITTRQWLAAFAVAGMLHLYVSGMFLLANAEGAEDLGKQGVKIDLGMLGDMGEVLETLESSRPVAAPIPKREPEETIEPPIEQPEPKLPERKPEEVVRVEPKKPVALLQADLDRRRPEPFKRVATKQEHSKTHIQNRQTARSLAMAKMSTGQAHAQSAGGDPNARRSYIALLAAKLRRNKHYPISARRNRDEGETTLFLVVDRHGGVVEARISKSSGVPALDASVLRILEKAKPLPPFPPEMQQPQLSIHIPVSFRLHQDFD